MPDVQEVFRLATNKVDPDPDALERQVRRQRAESRKSRVRAYIAVAAVVIVAAIAGFALSRAIRSEPTPEGTGTPTPSVATDLTFLQALPAGATQPITAIVDLRGKQTSTIGGVPLDAYAASVTPDGTQMAFIASPNEVADNQVGMMGTDGSRAHFVATPGIDVGWTVAISPDGTRVAFEGAVDGNTDIWVVNSDGTGLLRLTHDPATDQYPTWSPDGTTITYDNAGSNEHLVDPQFSKTAEIFSVPAGGTSTLTIADLTAGSACSVTATGPTAADLGAVDGGTPLVDADGQLRGVAVTVDRGTTATAHLTYTIPFAIASSASHTGATSTTAAGSGSAASTPPPLPGGDGAASAAAPVALAAARSTTTASSAALPDTSGSGTTLVLASIGILLCGSAAYVLVLREQRGTRTHE